MGCGGVGVVGGVGDGVGWMENGGLNIGGVGVGDGVGDVGGSKDGGIGVTNGGGGGRRAVGEGAISVDGVGSGDEVGIGVGSVGERGGAKKLAKFGLEREWIDVGVGRWKAGVEVERLEIAGG